MKFVNNLATVKFCLLVTFIGLLMSACQVEDISSAELKNSQWLGISISGWRLENGIKKNLSQNLGDNYGRFDLSFNGSLFPIL